MKLLRVDSNDSNEIKLEINNKNNRQTPHHMDIKYASK